MSAGERLRRRRSGACYDDSYPEMHALCSGRTSYQASPFCSSEDFHCSCPCHTPAGAHLRGGEAKAAGT